MNWDYAALKQNVADYLARNDLGDMIPTFIALAERRMQADLRLRCMERRATNMTSPGAESLPLPNKRIPGDWDVFLDMREVTLQGSPPGNLEYVNPDRFTEVSGTSGRPEAYTIVGREMLLTPTPDAEYIVTLTYFSEIPPLGDSQPTNDFLLTYPQLYLYGALVESAAYTRGSVPVEMWMEYYRSAKEDAEYSDRRARFSKQVRAQAPRRF